MEKSLNSTLIHTNARPLRILFIGFAYIVGVYQSKLKSIQDAGSVDVIWLAPTQWNMLSWNRTIPLDIKFEEVAVYPVKISFLNGVNGGYLYPPLAILHAVHKFKPDILHYEQEVFSLSAFQAALWARIFRLPFTAFCWENIEKNLPFYRRWTTKFVMNTASAIIAGNTEATIILRKWGFKRKILVMPQIGVDTNLFATRRKKQSIHTFTIGYIGRLVPEKGVDVMLDAVQNLLKAGTDLRVVICGSGSEEINLRTHAQKLGIEEHVSWLGAVAHHAIPDILAELDVVVLPSRTLKGRWKEQFGHILIEAMAMSIPVIGSNSGAIPEVIGRNDLIFPEDNSEALAQILERMTTDREWTNEVATFLENRAISEYSDERIATRLVSIWREILEEKKEAVSASTIG